jgi:hypothetical protein
MFVALKVNASSEFGVSHLRGTPDPGKDGSQSNKHKYNLSVNTTNALGRTSYLEKSIDRQELWE